MNPRLAGSDIHPAPPAPYNWRDYAKCKNVDPEIFFPENNPQYAAEAKRICLTCPVIKECDDFARSRPERHGIWAGVSRERT